MVWRFGKLGDGLREQRGVVRCGEVQHRPPHTTHHPYSQPPLRPRTPHPSHCPRATRVSYGMFCPECGTWNRAAAAACASCTIALPLDVQEPSELPDAHIGALRQATG